MYRRLKIAWKIYTQGNMYSGFFSQKVYTICDCGQDGVCPLQVICLQTGLTKQTVNSVLRKLEKEDVLYLKRSGVKQKTVCLTENGKLLVKNTATRMLKAENAIWESR